MNFKKVKREAFFNTSLYEEIISDTNKYNGVKHLTKLTCRNVFTDRINHFIKIMEKENCLYFFERYISWISKRGLVIWVIRQNILVKLLGLNLNQCI